MYALAHLNLSTAAIALCIITQFSVRFRHIMTHIGADVPLCVLYGPPIFTIGHWKPKPTTTLCSRTPQQHGNWDRQR